MIALRTSLQATKIPGPQSNAKQCVVRRVNWKDKKEHTERHAVENLCRFTDRSSWKMEPREQNDSVDITARSPDGKSSEDFQIVRLWEQSDWQALNTTGVVDRDYSDPEAVELFRTVFGNKGQKYPVNERRELTLLIDANPVANVSDFTAGVENAIAALARQAAYKSVWVVGTADARQLA